MECEAFVLIMGFARAGVLLIAALGAVLCVYLGWKLYKDAVVSKAKGEFAGAGLKFTLTAASPGVFLVAFGIWLLMSLVGQTATLESTEEQRAIPRAPTSSNVHKLPTVPVTFTYMAQAEDAKRADPEPCQPCLLKKTKAAFFAGEKPLEPAEIRDAMYKTIAALQVAGKHGVPDVVQRAALISTLREIAEAADVQTTAR